MSQRFLIPTNLFYHWQDPWPPDFPTPNTGDVYLNVSSQMLRVFYDDAWHDAGSSNNASQKMIVSTDAPSGIPAGGPGTVWIQY